MKMAKWLRVAAAIGVVCLSAAVGAQQTTVTTTHLGTTSNPLVNGTVCWQVVNAGKNGGQILGSARCVPVTSGASSIQLPDALAASPNVCYRATAIDNATGNVALGAGFASNGIDVAPGGAYGCIQPTGSTWDFDAYVPPATPPAVYAPVPGPPGTNGANGVNCATGEPAGTCNVNGILKATYVRLFTGMTLAIDGDSRCSPSAFVSRGDGTTAQFWTNLLQTDLASPLYGHTILNACVGGSLVSDLASRYTATWHALSPSATGTPGVFFVQVGINNLIVSHEAAATTYTALRAYWNTLQADGWQVVAFTVYPTVFDYQDTFTKPLNALIRKSLMQANPPYAVVDEARVIRDPYDTTISNDALHLSAGGMALEEKAVIEGLNKGPLPDFTDLYAKALATGTFNWRCIGAATDTMKSLTSGSFNTFCGTNGTGASLTTGGNNTAYGSTNLNTLSTGSFNTAVGNGVATSIGAGSNHTDLGAHSDYNSLSSNDVIAIGVSNLENATASTLIAIGDNSANNASISNGIIIGHTADPSGSGAGNVIVGNGAAPNFTTDFNSVCVGSSSCGGAAATQGFTAVGANTQSTATNAITSGVFGFGAKVGSGVTNAFQIGQGTNSTSNSLQFLGNQVPVILIGITGNIGGSALTAGQCTSGTASVTGVGSFNMGVIATPTTYPGDGFIWHGYVTAAGTVTVKVCAIVAGTPSTSTYNVRVFN